MAHLHITNTNPNHRTGTFYANGKMYKVIGWDFVSNKAMVKNQEGQYKDMSSKEIEAFVKNNASK